MANQIAAGEVVQRPSSIIKEMVENSIDAGAENIQILVVDGGKTEVQIVDDGKGMSETDARLAFERHATSKIRNATDLFNLTTMGFRGEALASIAAVAQVELKTRRAGDELGTHIQISGSKIESQEPVVCPVGCNFSVKNLFYNVPARRRFLKSNQTELTNVIAEFERIALVYPSVSFTLYSNGSEMFKLPKTSVRQRIVDVFGKKINSDLLPIEVETSLVSISGYIAKPESSKKKGTHQYFFANGRFMRNPYFHSAIMRAYDNLIPVGDHISYFVYFAVDPHSIDVNVHPTKTEIKFDNEQAIWQVLTASVRESLGKFCALPMIDFDVEGKPDIPAMGVGNATVIQPKAITTSYNPFMSDHGGGNGSKQSSPKFAGLKDEDDYFSSVNIDSGETQSSRTVFSGMDGLFDSKNSVVDTMSLQPSSSNLGVVPVTQCKGKYILCKENDGLRFIDQRRAHIRILFEQNMKSVQGHARPTQRVLFPEIVQFTKEESVLIETAMDDLENMGFELSNLGNGAFSVLGVPPEAESIKIDAFLHDIASSLLDRTADYKAELSRTLALSLAKASAINYGQSLSMLEMEKLVSELYQADEPSYTPDGLKTFVFSPYGDIDNLFH